MKLGSFLKSFGPFFKLGLLLCVRLCAIVLEQSECCPAITHTALSIDFHSHTSTCCNGTHLDPCKAIQVDMNDILGVLQVVIICFLCSNINLMAHYMWDTALILF